MKPELEEVKFSIYQVNVVLLVLPFVKDVIIVMEGLNVYVIHRIKFEGQNFSCVRGRY